MRSTLLGTTALFCTAALCRSHTLGCVPTDDHANGHVRFELAEADARHRTPADVSVDAGRVAVGLCHLRMSGCSGHVDIYELQDGEWSLYESIATDERTAGTAFGQGVALCGQMCAVGAPGALSGRTGSVLIFEDTDDGYTKVAQLQPDRFIPSLGHPIALTSDFCAVSALSDRTELERGHSGTVFVFKRTESGWKQDAEIVAPQEFNTTMFGGGLALSGETLAISAGGIGEVGDLKASPVFVYRRNDDGWTLDAILEQHAMKAGVGPILRTVSVDDDRIAIGGPAEPPGFRVGIYECRDGEWIETSVVTREGDRPIKIATAVHLRGNSLIVGRGGWTGGTLYVYDFDEASRDWQLVREVRSELDDSWFATTVASDGEHVVTAESRKEPHLATIHIIPLRPKN